MRTRILRFVFSRLFYFLVALALVPLSLSWEHPWLRWVALAYNILLLAAAFAESRFCQLPKGLVISREFGSRFAMGAETEVRIHVQNVSNRAVSLILKDEYPPQMSLSGSEGSSISASGRTRSPPGGTRSRGTRRSSASGWVLIRGLWSRRRRSPGR